MTALEVVGLALLVTTSMAAVDYCHARYALAMIDFRSSDRRVNWRGAGWSVLQWSFVSVAFYVNVRVSMWFLPFEGAGLFLGTLLGSGRSREA